MLDGEVWRVVSYALVHQPGNIFHIIFTAIFLVWIGHQVEDLYGSKEYLAYFALTNFLGGVAYTVIGAFTNNVTPLVGPSGGVTAILVLFALHYPPDNVVPVLHPDPGVATRRHLRADGHCRAGPGPREPGGRGRSSGRGGVRVPVPRTRCGY